MSKTVETAIMDASWGAFLRFAIGNEEICAEFTKATGHRLSRPRTGIEALVDDATGYRDSVTFAFIEWVTRNHWGMRYAPKAFRDEVRKRKKRKP